MSDKKDYDLNDMVFAEYGIDEAQVEKLTQLMEQQPKRIYQDGPMTIIEFENGQILPLYGGGAILSNYVEPSCSFCNRVQSEVKHLAGSSNEDGPLICSECATHFVELFAKNGAEIELNLSVISPELAKKLASLTSKES